MAGVGAHIVESYKVNKVNSVIQKINSKIIDKKILSEAATILKKGGIIIYPTDTAYAVGCDATNKSAVDKIFKIKKRTAAKSLPVIVGSLEMAEKFFLLNKKERELAMEFWTGAHGEARLASLADHCLSFAKCEKFSKYGKLSLVLKVKGKSVAENVLAKDCTVAVRASNSLWARELAIKLGKPIVSTSANLSGTESCYSINQIKKTGIAYKNIDLILDAGKLPHIAPSTVVKVKNGKVEILREGSVKISNFSPNF